jgi:hypothetical protein
MKDTDITEGDLLCSKFIDWNVYLIENITYTEVARIMVD